MQLYSIRAQMAEDMDTALDAVAAAGYSFVELAGYNPREGTFYGLAGPAFTQLCRSKGLVVLSSHINGPDPNTASWEECLAWWDKAITDHAEAGIAYIVQPSMWKTAYASLEGLLHYCELLTLWAKPVTRQESVLGTTTTTKNFLPCLTVYLSMITC